VSVLATEEEFVARPRIVATLIFKRKEGGPVTFNLDDTLPARLRGGQEYTIESEGFDPIVCHVLRVETRRNTTELRLIIPIHNGLSRQRIIKILDGMPEVSDLHEGDDSGMTIDG
jgi:hypothetical protein